MGKVLVTGHAEKDVAPDYAKVVLTVKAEGETADKATASVLSEFERLISELIKTGFDNDSMTIMMIMGIQLPGTILTIASHVPSVSASRQI